MKSRPGLAISGRSRWAAVAALAVGLGGVILAVTDDGVFREKEHAREGWNFYRNAEHAYSIQYPPSWALEEERTKCDESFCIQGIELKNDDRASVFVFVNFQGGWCEGSLGLAVTDIVVSGYKGKEYRCPGFTIRSFGAGDSLIRYFPGVKGKINYFVLGQAHADLSEVEAIIETFEFVD